MISNNIKSDTLHILSYFEDNKHLGIYHIEDFIDIEKTYYN